ncbi:MAG TPA: histidine kinase, partial [Algoriphagus sp.]|nr:histidine kinase [Algoriphagus sp.]
NGPKQKRKGTETWSSADFRRRVFEDGEFGSAHSPIVRLRSLTGIPVAERSRSQRSSPIFQAAPNYYCLFAYFSNPLSSKIRKVTPEQLIIFVLLLLLIGGGIGTIFLFKKLQKISGENRKSAELLSQLEQKTGSLRLETLESKLNPHLFKNILNSIQSHAYQTYFALDKLANVLDYILYESRQKFVSPKEEIDFALNLIEINKIKLSPLFELSVKTKIEENNPLYLSKILAPMISIDLIENAFKHADLQSGDSFIRIIIELKAGVFSILVTNKVSEKTSLFKANSGLGMESLDQRLNILYKGHYTLERFKEGEVFLAQLKIDLNGKGT